MSAQAEPRGEGRRRTRWRPFAKLWHRWFGLLAGLWLMLLTISGTAIVFYNEIDTWLNPDIRVAPAASGPGSPTPVGDALANAQRTLPGFSPGHVELPNAPGEVIWIIGRQVADGPPQGMQVFADPHTGAVLGWRESGKLALDRRHIMDVLYGLHIYLLLGEWMTWVLGLVSLLWVLDHIVAVVLAVPSLRRWADAFRVRGAKGSLRQLFDLHRAPGMWLFPVTAMLAVTGVTLAWPEDSRDAVRLLSPVSERLDFGFPDAAVPDQPFPVDRALVIGAGGREVDSVRVIPAKAVYGVRTFDARDVDSQGRMWTYVSMQDGRIVGRRHDVGSSAGDTFFAWQYALHSGEAFGLIGRWLVFIGGVGTGALCVTGVWLWLRRRRPSAKTARLAAGAERR